MNAKHPTPIVRFSGAALVLVLASWAPAALAQTTATLTAGVHLRAGPDIFYPSVVIMPPGAAVQVFGCMAGFNWCDVAWGAQRGWVDAAFLQANAPTGPVIIANSAPLLGVPVVTFSFNNYWGAHYVGRPWYSRRAFYYNHWNRWPQGRPPPIYRPRPPPPMFRPPPRPPTVVRPPPRPPSTGRPPSGTRPPASRPPPGGQPPPNNRPPGSTRPAPGTSPQPQG
jgi:uncharacterized protein YraI